MSEEMSYAHLSRSGLRVSRIGLGTMNFGYTVDEPSSFAVMDAAIDAGIGPANLADLFERRRQLIVYRAFYAPDVTTYRRRAAPTRSRPASAAPSAPTRSHTRPT
jgi:aryl-alcohol dehydrogenase-like predicted oxidoreductase